MNLMYCTIFLNFQIKVFRNFSFLIRIFVLFLTQVQQSSKKRKVHAEKWILFGVKWSPYENAAGNRQGCTNYAGTSGTMEKALRRGIRNAVDVFSLPLGDLYLRQKKIMDHLVEASPSHLGLAVAVGKNYSSSSHVDEDMGFTFG